MADDTTLAALGITAVVVSVQEALPFALPPVAYRAMRAGMAVAAPLVLTNRRPWQRAVVAGLGIWGATELLQLGYSALMLGADTLLVNITQRRNRFGR